MLQAMERVGRTLEDHTPKPKFVTLPAGKVFRYVEKDIYQAMIQKLARVRSLVRAAEILLEHGHVQEQAILSRAIDETNEDIMFLVYAVTNDRITDLHKRYLEAFWMEEVDDSGNIIESQQKRPMIPRRKIRAYLAKLEGIEMDPHTATTATTSISKAYSGFVHGASPHIMDMYGGSPPHFHTQGMHGTPRVQEHAQDLWNYFYRSFLSHIAVVKAYGAENLVSKLYELKAQFESNANKSYG